MKALSKLDIISVDDTKKQRVDVPEWGGFVFVKTMTAAQKDNYEQSIVEVKNGKVTQKMDNIRAKLLARCVCDESSELLFNDDEVSELGKKSAAAIDRLFDVASALNAVTEADVEEIAKN